MSKPTPDNRVESPIWQSTIVKLLPVLYMTTLTIALPTILSMPFVVSEFAMVQEPKLKQQMRSISIKILAHGETIGSGVLLHRQQQVYTVITNAHVIQSASAPFQLQTPDGQIYAAALIAPPLGKNRDLSILRFQSHNRVYTAAKLAAASPKIGDRIWSAGFPLNRANTNPKVIPELNIVNGQIAHILPVAISGGYRIGFERSIEKGMSGGPTIDNKGELIGINGVHANPLWDTPETLENGSTVSEVLQEQINHSSWAIPIEFVKDYARF
jgi:S1-C subfamily serine protease